MTTENQTRAVAGFLTVLLAAAPLGNAQACVHGATGLEQTGTIDTNNGTRLERIIIGDVGGTPIVKLFVGPPGATVRTRLLTEEEGLAHQDLQATAAEINLEGKEGMRGVGGNPNDGESLVGTHFEYSNTDWTDIKAELELYDRSPEEFARKAAEKDRWNWNTLLPSKKQKYMEFGRHRAKLHRVGMRRWVESAYRFGRSIHAVKIDPTELDSNVRNGLLAAEFTYGTAGNLANEVLKDKALEFAGTHDTPTIMSLGISDQEIVNQIVTLFTGDEDLDGIEAATDEHGLAAVLKFLDEGAGPNGEDAVTVYPLFKARNGAVFFNNDDLYLTDE